MYFCNFLPLLVLPLSLNQINWPRAFRVVHYSVGGFSLFLDNETILLTGYTGKAALELGPKASTLHSALLLGIGEQSYTEIYAHLNEKINEVSRGGTCPLFMWHGYG